MNYETKRDVFDAVWNRLAGYQVFFNGWLRETLDGYKKRYDDALPDDLPVIPEYVADYIVYWKEQNNSLIDIALESAHARMDSDDSSEAFDWVHNHFEKFSRAWLDGYEVAE